MVFLTLPWTPAAKAQAEARVIRQGTAFDQVEVITMVAHVTDPDTGEDWSFDQQKLEVLDGKRTIADAVADGVIPSDAALKFGIKETRKALKAWQEKVRSKAATPVS